MKISLVVPVFNEEEAIPVFYEAVQNLKASSLGESKVELIFVDDGSSDQTYNILEALSEKDEQVVFVSFSRNFGKEPALFAGLEYSTGDVVIPIDVDLQDPLEIIPEMIVKYQAGAQVVLGKRADRSSDGFFKKKTAEYFYKIHNKMAKPKIEENVGDFRLMSRVVVDEILKLNETQLFMKGLLSWVGFKTEIVEYTREQRVVGKTKFNGFKLWNLALEGITSFSTAPLKLWAYLGAIISLVSFFYAFIIVIQKFFYGISVSGYASIMISILFLGGIQLIGIGVLGEYLGRVYMESKRRPKYVIQKTNIKKK